MLKKFSYKIILLLASFLVFFQFFAKKFFPGDNLIGLYHPYRDFFSSIFPLGYPYKNSLITDPFLQIFPWKYISVLEFKNLSLPLWNPYSFSGYPLLANFQSGVFFPLNYLLFSGDINAWSLFVLLQIPLSITFSYLFLKKIQLSTCASIFGSICFSLSGYSVGWLEWGNIGYIFALMPGVLYLILLNFEKLTRTRIILLYFSVVLIILTGHLQFAFYSLIIIQSFILFNFFLSKKNHTTILIEIIFILSVIFTSFQLIPTLEFIVNSNRSADISFYGQKDWFIPIQHFISFVSPDFFGTPARQNYWGVWNHLEFNLSFSITGLIFALSALWFNKKAVFFIFLLIISLIFAIENPISKVIYTTNIPFLSSAQPSRLIYVIIFSLSCLGAIGLDKFVKHQESKKSILISLSFLFIFVFSIFFILKFNFKLFNPIDLEKDFTTAIRNLIFPLIIIVVSVGIITSTYFKLTPKKIASLLVVFLAFGELSLYFFRFTPVSNSEMFYPNTKITEFLKHDSGVFRVATTDDRILPPNISGVYGIQSPEGYDPLYPKNYADLISLIETGKNEQILFNRILRPKNINSSLYGLLNVKYILSFDKELNDQQPIFSEGLTNVFINKNYLERAFVVYKIISAVNENDSKNKLLSDDFNPDQEAVVFGLDNHTFATNQASDTNANAIIESYASNTVKLKVTTPSKAMLILTDNYFPGWRVKVNGVESKVLRANHTFRGVEIPGGDSEVVFYYAPNSFKIGLVIALLSLLGIILIVFKYKKYASKN